MRLMFAHALDRQKEAVCPKGCLLFNSVDSEILKDVELYKMIRKAVERFEGFLEKEISLAIEKGEVKTVVNPKLAASLIITYIQGLMKLSVLDYSDSKFRDQTDYFLESLGL